jgi:outer membrane lipoprotein-sorting protein
LFLKLFLTFIIFFNLFFNLSADEKEFIIEKLSSINNFTFSFEQITSDKIENGNCILAFDNKLKCSYHDKLQKEIIVNNKTLVVLQKRYDKVYFYPISKSPFLNILNKNKLINLIQESKLVINDRIELVYLDKNQKKITVFFEKEKYELIGWLLEDQLQNEVFFSLKINKINSEINDKIFKIPRIN